jgi:hypothetical protein
MGTEEKIVSSYKILADHVRTPNVKSIVLCSSSRELELGGERVLILPALEGDVIMVEIAPPILTPPIITPPPTVKMKIADPNEGKAVAYGISARVNLHGSSWQDASNALSAGWLDLRHEHGMDWETAKPSVVRGWNAAGYLLRADAEE